MRSLRLLSYLFFLSVLTACGGGDSSAPPPKPPIADFDGDGIADSQDNDDDNDGYLDTEDAFPMDSAEWLDSDSDGIGNNEDTDDDNDGVLDEDDAFPLDANESVDSDFDGVGDNSDDYPNDQSCYLQTDGNGSTCYLTLLKQQTSAPIIRGSNEYIYFTLSDTSQLLALNTENQHFDTPLNYDNEFELEDFLIHPTHERIYLRYGDGSVKYFDQSKTLKPSQFTLTSEQKLVVAGPYLFVSDMNSVLVYDVNGIETGSARVPYNIQYGVWNEQNSTFFASLGYSNQVHALGYFELNSDGEVTIGRYEYPSSNVLPNTPLFIELNDSRLMFLSGEIFSKEGLSYADRLDINLFEMIPVNDEQYLSTRYVAGNTTFSRLDNEFNLIDMRELEGAPKVISGHNGQFTLITETIDHFKAHNYDLTNDVDGDGISNELDAFPMDIAASLDADNDGFPDSWNDGYSQVDSTSSLTLDLFPDDNACWATEHDNGQGECNFGATMPSFTPEKVEADADGILYLFSEEHSTVYRWSSETQHYLSPIKIETGFIGSAPIDMAFSQSHQRLYFGYQDGQVTFIDIENPSIELDLVQIPKQLGGLAMAGNFLLVQGGTGSWSSHYIFDKNGKETAANHFSHYSDDYTWNAENERMYFFSQRMFPNDLEYEQIDQTTGEIVDNGDSPYHGDFQILPPVRASNDGRFVLLGSGDIYDADTLNWQISIDALNDAIWLSSGELVTVNALNESTFTLTRRTSDLTTIELSDYEGHFIRIIAAANKVIIISELNGELTFIEYVANNDTDGDGVDNLTDAFPMDVAASLDSDNDGYPDEWNDGYSEADSTTDLTLDSFPNDSACWLVEHDNGQGQCDYAATMPSFVPDLVLSDSVGGIYLYSEEHSKVFRWSAQSNAYTNPLIVGRKMGLSTAAPKKVELSQTHNRLYFGYESGEITYVDLANIGPEKRFANTAHSVGGIASVGNHVLAQGVSGSAETIYIFDVDGNQTDYKDWHYYSRVYAWNKYNNRVYYFRDNSSPNDLMYLEMDQQTGKVTESGETPYHGAYSIRPPIRVSNTGQLVLLGSGDLYDANTLEWQSAIDAFSDALWLANGELVTVTNTQDNTFVLNRYNSRFDTIESLSFTGQFIRVIATDNRIFIVSRSNDDILFTEYVVNNDTDGDGVSNILDAFPTDPAASVDSDNDGFPDQWNSGYTEADSTTGLTLDIFPQDSACWLAEHDDGQGSCDYSATMPIFVPDEIASNGTDHLYLFSKEYGKVYRWSSQTQSYTNPIQVGKKSAISSVSPNKMAYSPSHQRLYFGYESGEITYVDVTNIGPEMRLANTASAVNGLASVGNYLLAQDASGAWESHYIFDRDGNKTDYKDWNHYSRVYAWNEQNNRVYFFSDGTSPNDLHFEVIDQQTGKITGEGETPYHGDYSIRPPIHVINQGDHVLLGSGDVYDADSMQFVTSLTNTNEDAVAFSDVFVVANSNSELKTYDSAFSILLSQPVNGELLAIEKHHEQLVVVSRISNELHFEVINYGDSDGDNMPAWWEIKYGLSDDNPDDAIGDLDNDGLSNQSEYLFNTSPIERDTDNDELSDFDEINSHSTKPLVFDTDGDGLGDGQEVLTVGSDPLVIDTDGDTFSDGDEVLKYNTDPLDADAKPIAISAFTESFEQGIDSAFWQNSSDSAQPWQLSDAQASDGTRSIRSGEINHNQQSGITYSALLMAGKLTFDAKVSSESCCDMLKVYLNDVFQLSISSQADWQKDLSIDIPQGENKIEWRYTKDSSVSESDDAVWIDNIKFVGQTN